VRFFYKMFLVGCLFTAATSLEAAHTRAQLLLGMKAARPGETVIAGVVLRMDAKWHTYWRNPGASGMATRIDWDLPPGFEAGEVHWPVPRKLYAEDDLTTYVYYDQVVLLAPIRLATDLVPGPKTIRAKVSWLECDVACLPGDATVEATLVVGPASTPSEAAELLKDWQNKLPVAADGSRPALAPDPSGFTIPEFAARWDGDEKDSLRPLVIEWTAPADLAEADFYPFASEDYEVKAETERLPAEGGKARIRKQVKKLGDQWPDRIAGLVIQQTGPQQRAFQVEFILPGLRSVESAGSVPPALSALSLWKVLIYAFIGGLILNIMPCVLPVIALKILGFVGQAREEPARVRALGLVYAVGVIVSFLVLAGMVIGVKAAGHKAGWGMQFGNPQFLVLLTVLITLVALNLFGLFEITPGARVMDAAGNLASKQGAAGAFFNGVLATILATPCTAPFLGVALGFAFTQSTPMIVLIFVVVALGLASPYVVLSWHPAWLKFVPRPGKWMERFKVAMGFPMLGTAVWLYSLTPTHYGPRAWWLAFFLVLLALAAWIYGEFFQRGRSRRSLGLAIAIAVLLAGYLYAVERQLQWRSPPLDLEAGTPLRSSPDGIDWQPWSREAVEQARAAGRPVLVDFTADWCLTCQANKKFALEIPEVRARLKEINAVALLGDYTRLPANITEELNRYGRAGVPLVLVFPGKPGTPPIVLPEALTPGMVLDALTRAARS
jgi:thiol:disulfide interchange protein DsbD